MSVFKNKMAQVGNMKKMVCQLLLSRQAEIW